MKPQYKDHLTEWRPDYPPVFYVFYVMHGGLIIPEPERVSNRQENINAFAIARDAISKAISSQP
ncbi:MAG: hypothetical protein Tp1137MES00d2C23059491_44 [Prokaryotic dsDNA virus sp.]|nr:MAG: hypothetical protein Tp1137MES00d2C23059491_44 [Prokaryotic dsDNA virus sp.]|tara:strand:- start:10722 stop:10913 length:192 start_codon:yes stop_codon:yes gene_type:complete